MSFEPPADNNYGYLIYADDGTQVGAASTEDGAICLAGFALSSPYIGLVYVTDLGGQHVAWIGDPRRVEEQ